MIDNKKIEEAAINKCGFISSEFYSGAKWAIDEFLKDLWHPFSEIPEIGRMFIMDVHYSDGRIELYSRIRCETFHNPLDPTTQKWFYLDDITLKYDTKADMEG